MSVLEIPLPSTTRAEPVRQVPTGIQRLNQRHLAMIELALAGLDRTIIAQRLDMTPENVTLVMKSPLFQDELSRRRSSLNRSKDDLIASEHQSAASVIKEAALTAASEMTNLLQDTDARVRLAASKDILDRAGIGRDASGMPVVHVTADKVQLLIVALDESRRLREPQTQLAGVAATVPSPVQQGVEQCSSEQSSRS